MKKSYRIFIFFCMNMILVLVIGMLVGMANIVPGVSGGTIAVVFNVYDELLKSITLNFKKLIKNWKFVVPIFLGMAIGVLLFSKGISFLYSKFPLQTTFAFAGLIFGSIPLIYKYMSEKKKGTEKKIWLFVCIAIGILVIVGFSFLQLGFDSGSNEMDMIKTVLPELSTGLVIKVFVAGFVGAVGMIIPGISGSLIMLIMGVYPIVIQALSCLLERETMIHSFLILFPFGIGVLAGLLCGAKLISILLEKCPSYTYAVILGLIIGSFITMIPNFNLIESAGCAIGCIICFVAGALLSYFSSKLTVKKE